MILWGMFFMIVVGFAVVLYLRRPRPWPYGNLAVERPLPFQKRFYEEAGRKICYVDEGEGERTVLFLHGNTGGIHHWESSIQRLSRHYRCLALDLPGWWGSGSTEGESEWTLSSYREAVVRFLRGMGVPRVDLVGHSMGGQIALMIAIQHPEWVDRLIVISPSGFWDRLSRVLGLLLKLLINENVPLNIGKKWEEHLVGFHFFYDRHSPACEELLQRHLALFQSSVYPYFIRTTIRLARDALGHSLRDQLKRIQAPTLILWGRNDRVIPYYYAAVAASEIPDSVVRVFPRCGHLLMMEKPDDFAEAVRRFLQ